MTLPYNTCSELPDKLQFVTIHFGAGTHHAGLKWIAA